MRISILTKEEMGKLTTKRLLAYKNKLMQVPETSEDGHLCSISKPCTKLNKTCLTWQGLYLNLKHILSEREHIERIK